MEQASPPRVGDGRPPRRRRNLLFGALLVIGGLLLMVENLTVFHIGALWPLFIVGVGIVKIVDACCARSRRTGVAIVGLGTWFSINEFTHLRYHDTWPLLLLLWGMLLIWNGLSPDRWCPTCSEGRHAH